MDMAIYCEKGSRVLKTRKEGRKGQREGGREYGQCQSITTTPTVLEGLLSGVIVLSILHTLFTHHFSPRLQILPVTFQSRSSEG